MNELQEVIGKTITAFGQTILDKGLPKGPFIIQGEPGKEYGFFIAVWPNTGERAEDELTLKKR